jgi:hypothetical protein
VAREKVEWGTLAQLAASVPRKQTSTGDRVAVEEVVVKSRN